MTTAGRFCSPTRPRHANRSSLDALYQGRKKPIQLSKREVLDALYQGRKKFTTAEWKQFLLRSVGLEPSSMTERNADVLLLRMVAFVENNYNAVELGPRGTLGLPWRRPKMVFGLESGSTTAAG